jgi:hypothetical protein
VTLREIRALAREAYIAGQLKGGDPYTRGGVPADIMRTIRISFEGWWRIHKPAPKLTSSQALALATIAAGKHVGAHIVGRSAHGGLSGTLASLHRRGYLAKGKITLEGRAALRRFAG